MAAGKYLVAGYGIAPFGSSRDQIIVNVSDRIPSDKHSVEECYIFKNWIPYEPIYEQTSQVYCGKSKGDANHRAIWFVTGHEKK
jgi:hypothetical protein